MQDFATAEEHAAAAFARRPADPEVRALKATVDFRHPGDPRRGGGDGGGRGRRGPRQRRGADGADRRPAQRRRAAGGAAADRRGAGAGPRRRGPAPRPARGAGAARRPAGQPAPSSNAWPRSSPTTTACARRWSSGTCAPAIPPAPRRCCAPRRRAPPRDPQAALTLAQFLLEVRGADAARAELQARIAADRRRHRTNADTTADTAAGGDPRPFQRALAGLDFSQGRNEAGIAALRELLDGAEPLRRHPRPAGGAGPDAGRDRGAGRERRRSSRPCSPSDPTHVAALKLHARTAIDADQPDQAVAGHAHRAQAQAPHDAGDHDHHGAGPRARRQPRARRRAAGARGRGLGPGAGRRACATPAS